MTRANSARAHAPRSSMHIPFRDAKKAAAPVRNKSARQASAFRFGSALFAARECAGCFSYSYMHQPIVERPAACGPRTSASAAAGSRLLPAVAGVFRSSSSRVRLVDPRVVDGLNNRSIPAQRAAGLVLDDARLEEVF